MKYWATKNQNQIIDELTRRVNDYDDYLSSSGIISELRDSCKTFYGDTKVRDAGDQGELKAIRVNHYASLIRNLVSLVTQNKPAWQPIASNTDSQSQSSAILASGLLDFYMKDRRLDRVFRNATLQSCFLKEAWVATTWDVTQGEVLAVDPDSQQPLHEGDLKYSSFLLSDVIRDFNKQDSNFDWLITREYVNKWDLMPQLLTIPNSKLIMASSSPLSPSHEFVNYINEARLNGSYSSYDITQGGYPEEIVEEFIKEAGGRNSTTCRREYFNEIITDSEYAIIPEWDSKKYVREINKDDFYKFYHHYRAADWGVRDKTAIIWGYYNFKSAQLIIEDEFTCSGQDSTTRNIANNIKSKETSLGYKNIYRSPADNNNLILLQDLGLEFDTHFVPTSKDTLAAMVNELRLWVQNGRIIINPRCKELISCLEFGVFSDNKRKEFGRSKALGHFDALAALIYLVRNVDQNTNPIPVNHNTTPYSHFTPPRNEEIDNQFKKIFNL